MNIFKKNIKENKKRESIYGKQSGFTLVEIIITIGIFSLIMGALGVFARNVFYYDNISTSGLTTYDEARKVLQPIASEIRSASPSSLGSYSIETAGDTNFIFFADINNDGLKERIRYYLSVDILKKGVITPTGNPLQYLSSSEIFTEVIHGVKNGSTPIFAYYDANYNGKTASLSQPISILNVRLIKITLILDKNSKRSPTPITVTTQIGLRNLKDNL